MQWYLRHYPALRAPVGDYAPFSYSLGIAKASFVSALAPSSILIEGEFYICQLIIGTLAYKKISIVSCQLY